MKSKFYSLSLIVAMSMTSATAWAQQEDINQPMACPVYESFTEKPVYLDNVDWSDTESVTAFIMANVPDIPEGYRFETSRMLEDIKGYRHIDCQQIIASLDAPCEGYELIVHTDAKGRLLYITAT